MSSYSSADLRNIAVVGHGNAGKTSLIEAMLARGGVITRKGAILDGTTASDFEKEEKEHRHSVYSTVVHLDHEGKRINLIDTPGSPDLAGQALGVLSAVETTMVVVSAVAGVELVTRRMMELAGEEQIPRIIVINKIDAPDIDLPALVQAIQQSFGAECLPVNLPADGGKRVIDCFLTERGSADFSSVEAAHTAIIEQIVELDEAMMERYLAGETIDLASLHAPFEQAMDRAHFVPILFTDAKNDVGISELLDFIARWLPSPLEGRLRAMSIGEGESGKAFAYETDAAKPLVAHVFKVMTDAFVGKLSIFRVYQGAANASSQVFVGAGRKPIKLGHLLGLQGKEHAPITEVIAGDIGAVAKIEELRTGDVMRVDAALEGLQMRPPVYPTPMYGLAITPKERGDEQKISAQLVRLAEEDPTFKWQMDKQTREVVITGLGELHLRLALERMANRGVHVDTKPPKIAYRETIQQTAQGHHRHKKQTGGAGQFGEVFLRVEPLAADSPLRQANGGKGLEVVNEVFGGAIPGQYIPAVEKGIHDVMEGGAIAGYPIQDIRVAITDGKHHPVDSKEVAFRSAGKWALREAIANARPVVLEPIVEMQVTVPEAQVGAITGDLSSKRGRIQGQDFVAGGMVIVKAQAPLSEVMQYQSQLKSVTGGQGSFAMEFSHYEAVPPQVQQQIVAAYKPQTEEE